MNLAEAELKKTYIIKEIIEGELTPRLFTMGVLQGTSVSVLGKSLFGDSYHVKIGTVKIGLRSSEMQGIIIK